MSIGHFPAEAGVRRRSSVIGDAAPVPAVEDGIRRSPPYIARTHGVRLQCPKSRRETNAWLNRELGITSVQQATLADLERSVELLVGKLSRRG